VVRHANAARHALASIWTDGWIGRIKALFAPPPRPHASAGGHPSPAALAAPPARRRSPPKWPAARRSTAPGLCGGAGRPPPRAGGQPLLLPPAPWPGKALSKPQQHTLRYARSQFSPGAAENPAGGRGGAPGGGWPGLARAGTPGRAAPDGPGAAPCAGVAGTASALVRVSGRHCAGRGKAPARAWGRCGGVREVSAVGRSLRSIRPPLAPVLRAAKGVRPSALSPSPPGELQGGGPARRLARPTRQSTRRSPACQRGQRNGQDSWPGCQLRLCRVASHG
jgi:hypothetical protein